MRTFSAGLARRNASCDTVASDRDERRDVFVRPSARLKPGGRRWRGFLVIAAFAPPRPVSAHLRGGRARGPYRFTVGPTSRASPRARGAGCADVAVKHDRLLP